MSDAAVSSIPDHINQDTLDPEIAALLERYSLCLDGKEPFMDERHHHTRVLVAAPPAHLAHVRIEPLIPGGPVGDFIARCYHPSDKVSGVEYAAKEKGGALIYIHGGGRTVGSLAAFRSLIRSLGSWRRKEVFEYTR